MVQQFLKNSGAYSEYNNDIETFPSLEIGLNINTNPDFQNHQYQFASRVWL